ncbi:MAG: sugar phosphate isomerase/epimerase [Chloroflexota bacterium]
MIALSTGSLYSYGLGRAFALAKEAGFQGVEVLVDDRWDTRQADYLNQLQREHAIPIVAVHSPFVPRVQGWERDQISRVKRTVALAEAVGARAVVVHLPLGMAHVWIYAPSFQERAFAVPLPFRPQRLYREWLVHELADYQATVKPTIVVENLPYKRFLGLRFNRYELNDLDALSRFAHVNLDTTHWATGHFDILAIYERLAGRIAHVHLSNYNGEEHQLPTNGVLPLDKLLQRLRADHFPGIVTLELDPRPLGAEDEDRVRLNLRQSYEFCQRNLS